MTDFREKTEDLIFRSLCEWDTVTIESVLGRKAAQKLSDWKQKELKQWLTDGENATGVKEIVQSASKITMCPEEE